MLHAEQDDSWTTHTHTHTHARLTALFPGLPGWAATSWILLKQETVSGSGISWAVCKSAPCSRQITTPATQHSVFYRPDALPAAKPTVSKHWRDHIEPIGVIMGWTAGSIVARVQTYSTLSSKQNSIESSHYNREKLLTKGKKKVKTFDKKSTNQRPRKE